jgi:signal peptidase I
MSEMPITNSGSIPTGKPWKLGRPTRPGRPFKQAGEYLLVGLLALASFFFFSHFFLQSVRVVGASMFPTLRDSQRYLLNRWIFYVRAPHRTDVVVIRDPADNGFSVKRIVAGAGDSILLKDGDIFVNGHKLDEPYLPANTSTFATSGAKEQTFTCGKNQFFVLGDNRSNSIDSRAYGPVPRGNILGLIIR